MRNYDLIFNLRIWGFHFQIEPCFDIKPFFTFRDFWIGFYFNIHERIIYFCPLPTIGFKIIGIAFFWNPNYKFKRDPFVWLFKFGNRYKPMRKYHNE